MLDVIAQMENKWVPNELDSEIILICLKEAGKTVDGHLAIFQTEPFIDSLYVKYRNANDSSPEIVKRFTFYEDYVWELEDEDFFYENCLSNSRLTYTYAAINPIYKYYSNKYQQWHLNRYYTEDIKLLDHIYHCMRKNSAKEILYKAGLDELAANINDIDEYNLLSSKPSDIYDGITVKTLKALNCRYGSLLLKSLGNRIFIKELNMKFPDLFKGAMNDAQCRYLNQLIDDKLAVGEAGRLFKSRCSSLASMWAPSQYGLFMLKEKQMKENERIVEKLEEIDPIYQEYFFNRRLDQDEMNRLRYYLLQDRENLDKKIRRANRKRLYDLQERNMGYVVRFPQTINDFCREAVYMRNCLLGYVDAFVNNDTDILFIRKIDNFNKPFITMEIYEGELMQAYHRFNKDCTEDEADWIRSYCARHKIGCSKFKFNREVDQLY